MYSLAVIHGTPWLASLISLLNSMGALFILMHVAIQVVYCHYMLIPFVELNFCDMLNFGTFV